MSAVAQQSAEQYADQALAFIAKELPGIDPVSAMLNQRQRPDGTLYDVMDVGWRMTPALIDTFAVAAAGADNVRNQASVFSTIFYSHPDASKDWETIVLHEIVVKASKVLSIYAGLGVVHKLPDPNVPVASIGADPTTVAAGEEVDLTWQSSDAITVTIEPGIGSVPLSGIRSVYPEVSTTYVLTAAGWLDTVTDSVHVYVTNG